MEIAIAVPHELVEMFFSAELLAKLNSEHRLIWAPDGANPHEKRCFRRLLADAEVVVTSWGCPPLDDDALAAAPRLTLLAHTGASVKPFVTPASWHRGIRVTQAGAGMAASVAEVCLALTLSLLHRVNRYDHALRTGVAWDETKIVPPRREIAGAAVGVIGASRTGVAYIQMVQALGAQVSVCDPYLTPQRAAGLHVRLVDLATLLRDSLAVAVHAPALPQTRHLLGAPELARLRNGAVLVNTARSWLIDENALITELSSGRIDAALDVYDEEPLPATHPLRQMPNVLLTPHEAGGSVEARRRQGEIIVDELHQFERFGRLLHEITEEDLARMG